MSTKLKDETGLPLCLREKSIVAQSDSVATDVAGVVSDFNDLLAKLKASGLMEG